MQQADAAAGSSHARKFTQHGSGRGIWQLVTLRIPWAVGRICERGMELSIGKGQFDAGPVQVGLHVWITVHGHDARLARYGPREPVQHLALARLQDRARPRPEGLRERTVVLRGRTAAEPCAVQVAVFESSEGGEVRHLPIFMTQ